MRYYKLILFFLAIIIFLCLIQPYPRQSASTSRKVTINKKFEHVRNVLIRKGTMEEILKRNGVTVISSTVTNRDFKINRLLRPPSYTFLEESNAVVEYDGSTMHINQKLHANENNITVEMNLAERTWALESLYQKITFEKQGEQTNITSDLNVTANPKMPGIAPIRNYLEKTVPSEAEKSNRKLLEIIDNVIMNAKKSWMDIFSR